MKYCPNCGTEVEASSKFCKECGIRLSQYRTQQSQVQEPRRQQQRNQVKTGRRSDNSAEATGSNSGLRLIGLLSAILVMVGTLLPWIEVEVLSVAGSGVGTEAAGFEFRIGLIILATSVVVVLLFLLNDRLLHILAGVCGLGMTVTMVIFLNDPLAFDSSLHEVEAALLGEVLSVEEGVWITLVGSAGVMLIGFTSFFSN